MEILDEEIGHLILLYGLTHLSEVELTPPLVFDVENNQLVELDSPLLGILKDHFFGQLFDFSWRLASVALREEVQQRLRVDLQVFFEVLFQQLLQNGLVVQAQLGSQLNRMQERKEKEKFGH